MDKQYDLTEDILIKRLKYLEDVAIVNIYTSKNQLPKCMKQNPAEMKGEIDNNRNFNNLL